MAVGEERPIHGKNGCWKDCLAIALDEATTALEENIYDLTDEQIWSRPIAEHRRAGPARPGEPELPRLRGADRRGRRGRQRRGMARHVGALAAGAGRIAGGQGPARAGADAGLAGGDSRPRDGRSRRGRPARSAGRIRVVSTVAAPGRGRLHADDLPHHGPRAADLVPRRSDGRLRAQRLAASALRVSDGSTTGADQRTS